MKYLMGTMVKEVFSLGTLLFIVIPFIAAMTAGHPAGNFIPDTANINFSLPSISGLQSAVGSSLQTVKLPMAGGHGALYVGNSRPVFLNSF